MHQSDSGEQASTKSNHSTIRKTAEGMLGPFSWVINVLAAIPYLGLKTLFRFEQDARHMSKGREAMGWWSDFFGLKVTVTGLEHVPHAGPILLYGNHPTGIGDGIALYDALKDTRPDLDLAFIMNAQGLEGTPAIADAAIHVKKVARDDRAGNKRDLWQALGRAVKGNRALVLFPSGHLSKPSKPWQTKLVEGAWKPGVIAIPKRFPGLHVIPFRITARNSRAYYWFSRYVPPIKNILLYTEFHAKVGARYNIEFLPPKAVDTPSTARAYVMGNN